MKKECIVCGAKAEYRAELRAGVHTCKLHLDILKEAEEKSDAYIQDIKNRNYHG